MRVAIIGAGLAGLQQGRALQKRGIAFDIFEADEKVGGVWSTTAHMQGAQVTWPHYQFAEFPWPEELRKQNADKVTPPAPVVQQYIELYARRFHLEQHIKFSSPVVEVKRPDGKTTGWTVTTQVKNGKLAQHSQDYDFVVLATGSFLIPRIPEIQGRPVFTGREITARQLTTRALPTAAGKRVVVVGSAKTALDVAGAAAEVAESVTMLARKAHYWFPLSVLGLIPYNYIAYTRLGVWLTTHPYPSSHPAIPAITSFFHSTLAPVKRLIWKAVGFLLPWQYGLPAEMIPEDRDAEADLFAELGLLNSDNAFLKHLRAGKIKVVRGVAERFTAEAVETRAGQTIPADLVIYACGFDRRYDYLSADVLRALNPTAEGIPLYRDTLPVDVPGMAFVGSEVITFDAVTTYGLQAEWVAGLLKGEHELPSKAKMQEDVARKQSWRCSFIPPHNFRVGRLATCCQLLCDELVSDLGHPKFRKGWGLLQEVWSPYSGQDYKEVFAPRNGQVKQQATPANSGSVANGIHANGILH